MSNPIKNLLSNTERNYYIILILLAASLPLSIFTTSVAEILLLVNWLAEGKFLTKFRSLKKNKGPLVISLLFLLHLIGLLYTSDFNYAFHDLKIKLPILFLPIIIGTSPALTEKRIRGILLWFSAAVLASTLISASIFFGVYDYEYYDFRDISIFISHIRLSLMVNLAIFIFLYYGFGGDASPLQSRVLRITLFVVVIWMIGFLIILKSITGILIFLILALFLGWKYSSRIEDIAPRFIIRVLIITAPLIIASRLSHDVAKFYFREDLNFQTLEANTPAGNPYFHDPLSKWVENGHYVWIYVCEEELRQEWNNRSSLDYDGKDKMGQNLRFTLIRYLTSKGFRKDADGMKQLETADIQAVENGVANYIFLNKYSLYPRVYQIIWELENYRQGNDPSGHSVAQRLAYINASTYILKNDFLIGVGTGDVQQAFNDYYENSENPLKKEFRRRAHNQFYTFLITFGILGFLISIFALFAPVFMEKRWPDFLFLCFAIIGFMSMLNEDTLETQTGVSFFMFFYSLLLFGRKRLETGKDLEIKAEQE